jgi:hypothetical protein
VITAVEPDARDPNFLRVLVGRTVVARLPHADAKALALAPGRRWTVAKSRKVAALDAQADARLAALRMLGRRSLGRAEMIRSLEARGHDRRAARRAVAELVENGWIEAGARAVARGPISRAR